MYEGKWGSLCNSEPGRQSRLCEQKARAQKAERELAEKTSEVARLREENADLKQWLDERYKALSEADEEVARLREHIAELESGWDEEAYQRRHQNLE